MTTYYVDPAATGSNNGTSWTDAWTSLQSAADTATAGDTVYCRGTQTLTATIDFDTNTGDNATNGPVKFIGCNASGVVDGTRFVLDGNSAATYCADITGDVDYLYFGFFEFKNATSNGLTGTTTYSNGNIFIGCSFNNNGGSGCYTYYMRSCVFIGCTAYGNTLHGFNRAYGIIYLSSSHDNGEDGIDMTYTSVPALIGCLIYDNGGEGIDGVDNQSAIFNNVIDGNADNGISLFTPPVCGIIGNRITNHSGTGDIGIDCNSYLLCHGWNYFENNDGDNLQNASLAIEILAADGSATDVEDQSDTNQGYTSLTDGSEDFNLRSDASLRRTAITIPTS